MSIGGDKRREETGKKKPRRGRQGEEEEEKPEAVAWPELEKRSLSAQPRCGQWGGRRVLAFLGGGGCCCPE